MLCFVFLKAWEYHDLGVIEYVLFWLQNHYTHTLSSFFNTKYPYIRGYYLVILDDRPKSILKVNKNFYDQLQLASTWNRADIAKSKLFKGVSFHSHVSYVVPHPISQKTMLLYIEPFVKACYFHYTKNDSYLLRQIFLLNSLHV